MSLVCRCMTGVALLLFAATAAANDDTQARARAHFETARGLYDLGRYREAAREFSAAHDLAPLPALVLNIGQCYYKLGELALARDMYRQFLREAKPDDPNRAQAREILDEVEQRLAAQPAPAAAPPPAAPPSAAPSSAAPSSAAPSAASPPPASPSLVARASVERRQRMVRTLAWALPVGVVVVGVAVGLGVYFGTRGGWCSGGAFCVDVTH